MPDPTKDIKDDNVTPKKDFWDNISEYKEEEDTQTFAKNNLTGITPANAKTAQDPEGFYGKLHDKVKLDVFGDKANWDKVGFSEQTNLDVASNTFFGTLTNIAGGFTEGVASNDIKGIFDMSLGRTEENYGNILNDWAKSIMEKSQENFHIYDDGEGASVFSKEYWGKQLQNTGYSAGIIVEMFAEQALLAAATRGQGNAATAGSLANRLKSIPGFLSKQSVFGSYQGIKEAYLNGLQTGEETYRKYKDLGYSDSDAKEKANEASTLGYRMEVLPLMTLNALQFAALGKYNPFSKGNVNTGYSGALETLSERGLKNIKNKNLRKVSDYAAQAVTEGIEEGIQTAIGKEAQYRVGLADGIVGETQLEDRLFGEEMRDSIIGGALGGTLFRFIGKRFNNLTQGTNAQEYQQEHDKYLETVAQRINNDLSDLKTAFDSGDQDQMDVIRKRMQRNNVLEALQLDLINQKETAFDSYISTLNETLTRVNGKTPEDLEFLKSQGVEVVGDIEHIQNNYPTYIEDAINIKEKLINNLQNETDYNVALQLTNHQKTLEELDEFQKRSESAINKYKTDSKSPYQGLSSTGKKRFDLSVEMAGIVASSQNNLNLEQKKRVEQIQSELNSIEDYDEKISDNTIIKALDKDSIIKEHININELKKYKTQVSDKISFWKNPDNQKAHTVKKAIQKVRDTKSTPQELNDLKEVLSEQDKLTPEVEEVVNTKIEKAEVQATNKTNQDSTPFVDNPQPTEILNPERQKASEEIKDSFAQIEMNEIVGKNYSTLNDEDLFEPAEITNLNDNLRNKLKSSVGKYYDNLKTEVEDPSFETFIRDFIKHNDKDSTERIYNALVEGWKANGLAESDFKKVYENIFKNRKEIAFDILGIADEIVGSSENLIENVEQNSKIVEDVIEKTSPAVATDSNNQTSLRDATPFRTSVPILKAAHLSIPYARNFVKDAQGNTIVVDTDTSEGLAETTDVNSMKLLNPNLFAPGTKLSIRIPDNYMEMKVSVWEDDITKGKSTTFGQWMKDNNVEPNSPEFFEKVPMIAYDQDGEGVFFVHDTDWYNPVNVGFKDDPAKQFEVIQEAKTNLRDFRNSFQKSSEVEIEITEKRPGTWRQINKDESPLTLNQANPQSQLALANDQGELILEGKEVFEKGDRVLINKKEFSRGHIYDIRQTGKNEYIAFEVLRNKLSTESITTVNNLVEAYLYQYDKEGQIADASKIKAVKDQVQNITGLNVFDRADFESLLNLYIPSVRGKFNSAADIANTVNTNNRIKEGSPYIAVQKGALVFGIKGQKISGNNEVLYIHPMKVKDPGGANQVVSMLSKFREIVPNMTHNVSKVGLSDNRNTVVIDENRNVIPSKNYVDHLKDNLTTSVKSFNVGTQDSPVYATIVQPIINFKKTGNVVDIKNPTESKIQEIKEKETLTNQEVAIVQSNPEKFDTVDTSQTIRDSIKALIELGVPESDPSIQALKEELGEADDFEPVEITEEDIVNIKEEITGIEGLTIIQDFQITDYVFNEISKKIDFKYGTKIDKSEILEQVRESYFNLIQPKEERNLQVLSNLKEIAKTNDKLSKVVEKMEKEIQIFQVVKDNWKAVEDKALDKIKKFTGIKESVDYIEIELDNGEIEKNYSKTSLEEGGKSTASYRLKRFLAGIKQLDAQGNPRTGFLGVPLYVGFDTAYATIEQVVSSPFEVDSNFEEMILRLEENIPSHQWLRQVVEQLKVADDQIKNELVYNFARHTLSMKFVMFSKTRNGDYNLKVYDTNSTEVTRVIRSQWESNLKNSPLVYAEGGVHKINKERAKFLLSKFNDWKSNINKKDRKSKAIVNISNGELQTWLEDFGIILSEDALNEMRRKDLEYLTKDGKETIPFSKLFEDTQSTSGIFGLLANYLKNIIDQKDTTLDENPQNHPFDNTTNALKTLSKIESRYSLSATTNSFRDGGKSIYGFTPTKLSTDLVKKLKFDQDFRNQLSNKSFSKNSYILDLLNNSEAFRNKFYIDHIGITAMKELGKKAFGDNSITSLSKSDHELTKLGLFQDTEQGELKEYFDAEKFIPMRMARMFFPTMSDKSQMLTLFTAVMELKDKHFNISETSVEMSDQVKEALYSQVVKPELERITNFVSNIKKTNIKGYDTAAQMFLMIPELNNMVDDSTGKRVISLLINDPVNYNMEWFEANMKEKSKQVISSLVNSEVQNKIAEWEDSGFVVKEDNNTSIQFLNQKYFNRFVNSDMDIKIKLAANDFVINSLMTNANIHMTIAGDIAMYSQDKIKKYFQNGEVFMPKAEYGDTVYSKISKDIISTNVGKRLALLLAPGYKLANSKGDQYTQIFLNDFIDITSNVPTLVELFYDTEESTKAKKLVERYNRATDLKVRQDLASQMSNAYPELADYFEIEATDAQEYTTLLEHIDVLFRQGRLNSSQYENLKNKAKAGSNLTFDELKIVFQPIKPVHTGFKNEDRFDTMRMMYIKSSSFPLIPQLTKGTELDKLRNLLESEETRTGKKVRASYQSANKVGSVTNPLTVFNPDGTFNTNISELEISKASLTLDRDNFRIQQDVPFKSGKKSADKVSLGTQTLKLLFGDGIMGIEDFEFNGRKVSGKELYKDFTNNYDNYIKLKKKMLFKQLGIDDFGNPIDNLATMEKLQKMLKTEAEERGYPKQDVEALKLVPKLDQQGNIVDVQFSLPLWLSPNSNRYESLLNAIVTNRLVNIKLPGNSYVVGTEAGFKTKGLNNKLRVQDLKTYLGEIPKKSKKEFINKLSQELEEYNISTKKFFASVKVKVTKEETEDYQTDLFDTKKELDDYISKTYKEEDIVGTTYSTNTAFNEKQLEFLKLRIENLVEGSNNNPLIIDDSSTYSAYKGKTVEEILPEYTYKLNLSKDQVRSLINNKKLQSYMDSVHMAHSMFILANEESSSGLPKDLANKTLNKELSKSNIIFTSAWEGELKAARIENGKLKKAQVLVPSKFRDNDGNIINLLTDTYTFRDESGMLRLKENVISPELLSLTSFRIPTSAHVSMSQVEIVGILPTEVGDLMIVPKNFTKQKGLDFDVDKETTYQLHTYVAEDGSIKVFDEEARQNILKAADSEDFGSDIYSNLLKGIFGESPDFDVNDFEPGERLDKINDKLQEKLYENEIIKAHISVLSNPSPKVQKKINKVLSMDFAKSQAALIQEKIEGSKDNAFFSMLSDSYQKDKMELGASGKLGIGVYSNYVVFHSMVQQSEKEIQLKQRDEKGKIIPLTVTIGNQTSNGVLGKQSSLSPARLQRSISEVFAERQNTATDNEKEQIMGRVNVNEITINVDSLLSALGFDKDTLDDGSQVSIPYLVLSQPVIRDLVEGIRKTQSNTNTYDSAAKEKVIESLKEKYLPKTEYNKELVPQMLTGQTLFNNLTDPNPIIQNQILDMFLTLDEYAKNLSSLQKRLNINNSGLGKSFFDTIEKYYGLQSVVKSYDKNKAGVIIGNASNLIGDYVKIDENFVQSDIDSLVGEGYIKFFNYLIKPNNPVGSMLVNSVQTGHNLWKSHFPYDDSNIQQVMEELMGEISSESASSSKQVELQQDIFKEMKKYVVSSNKLGTFKGDPYEERYRLFIDTEDKKSIANYLRELLYERGKEFPQLKSNKLLSRFQFTINKNGLPSLIKFDNSKGEIFDEDYLYVSLIELMDINTPLPDFNGQKYTTRNLAQDLIAYNYLEGGIQEAIQFSKYIPVSYLNTINFSAIAREWNGNYRPGIFKNILGTNGPDEVSRFTRQYAQHNPQRLTKIPDMNHITDQVFNTEGGNIGVLSSFKINDEALTAVESDTYLTKNFLAIYDPEAKKGLKKFKIFERSGDTFYRIPTLGVFGMSEYNLKKDVPISVVNTNVRVVQPNPTVRVQKQSSIDPFGIGINSTRQVLDAMSKYEFTEYPHLKPLIQTLIPFVPDSLTIKTEDLLNSKGDRIARGRYSVKDNVITIDKYYKTIASAEDLAKTVTHELIHGLSSEYINKYVDKEGNYLIANPPKEIVELVMLFNETRKKLGQEFEDYAKKREGQLSGEVNEATTERERTVAYAGTNIKEFVTLVMTEPNFQREMQNAMYRQSGKTLFEKLTDIVTSILNRILGDNIVSGSITVEGVKTSLEIIKNQSLSAKDLPSTNEIDQASDNVNESFSDFTFIQEDNLDEPSENSIFVIPFKC